MGHYMAVTHSKALVGQAPQTPKEVKRQRCKRQAPYGAVLAKRKPLPLPRYSGVLP
jgi:hypothetical protein